jgi:hypothetical protein
MMLSQVEEMREQLRPSERKLADYVIEAPREVLDLSMNEVAARAGVSQPTRSAFPVFASSRSGSRRASRPKSPPSTATCGPTNRRPAWPPRCSTGPSAR